MLLEMLEHQRTLSEFTQNGAIASLTFDRIRGLEKGMREYSRIWGWTWNKTRYHWTKIDAISTVLALKTQQPNNNPTTTQNHAIPAQIEGSTTQQQPNNNPQLINTNIIPISTASPKPSASSKNINKPKEGENRFHPSSWQYRFSDRTLSLLERFGVASPSLLTNRKKSVQSGAQIFDKLHRIDGHSKEEIGRVMHWLLQEQNENIRNRWFMSITKLRRPNDDGIKYFEVYQIKSRKVADHEEVVVAKDTTSSILPPSPDSFYDSYQDQSDTLDAEAREIARRLAS